MKSAVITVGALALAAGSAFAGPTFISQSSQGSVNNISFQALDFAGSIADLYDYSGFQFAGNSGDGPLLDQADLMQDKANVFLVNTSEGLGFYTVFDNGRPDNEPGSGTSANNAAGSLSFAPGVGNQTLQVEDDGNDNNLLSVGASDPFVFNFNWANGFTDGIASTFGSPDASLTLDLTSFKGIDGFNLIASDGEGGFMSISGLFSDAGGTSVDGLSDYITLKAIPMPHPAAMATVGIAGVAGLRRRRR